MTDTIVTVTSQMQTLTPPAGQYVVLAGTPQVQVITAGTQGPAGQTTPTGIATVTGTSYTLQAADYGKILLFTGNLAITVTCPNNMAAGFHIGAVQLGNGKITFSAASGATLQNAQGYNASFGQGSPVSLLVCRNTGGNTAHYILGGDVN